MDLRSGALVNGAIGAGFGLRGFGLPATMAFTLASEVVYAAMAIRRPDWVGIKPQSYRSVDFALDVGAALLGWGLVAAAKNGHRVLAASTK